MKGIRIFTVAAIAFAATVAANAQNAGDLLRFSQYNYSFGTARSAAMGGAMTSLGADLSSMSINPAGLGMYRSSEIGVSPSVTIGSVKSNFGGYASSENKTRFSIGNFGTALNVYNGSGAVTSFTMGLGYNKLVDFNSTGTAFRAGSDVSMLDYLAHKVQGYDKDIIGQFPGGFQNTPVDVWGSVLGYQTNMLNPVANTSDQYEIALGNGTLMNQTLRNVMTGSVGEYTISGGLNMQNKFYFGFTIGLQDIYYENTNTFYEDVASNQNSEDLTGYNYRKSLIMSGAGVNGKFGVVYRPLSQLRIGVAVHTPTYINIEDKYMERMISGFKNSGLNRDYESAPLVSEYSIVSPTRLLAGVSYAFPYGVISADYESVWYNGMRLKDTGEWSFDEEMKADVKGAYKQANNFRAGIELIPLPGFYIRGGYAYYDSSMQHDDFIAVNQTDINSYQNYTGGLGFRFDYVSLDLAYINTNYKYADYELYPKVSDALQSGLVTTKQTRHTITMSLGVRF